jgi:hypothetical protein
MVAVQDRPVKCPSAEESCCPEQQKQCTTTDRADYRQHYLFPQSSGHSHRQSSGKPEYEENKHECSVYDDIGPELYNDRARRVPLEHCKIEWVIIALKVIIGVI